MKIKVGDVYSWGNESFVIIATRKDGCYGVPVSGNLYRYSWVYIDSNVDCEPYYNILDRIPTESDITSRLSIEFMRKE